MYSDAGMLLKGTKNVCEKSVQEQGLTDMNELCSRVPGQRVQEHLWNEKQVDNMQEW